MDTKDSERIATLTADAIRASGDKTIADIRARLEMATEMLGNLQVESEAFIEEISKRTITITDHIGAYVAFCKDTTEMFKTAGEGVRALNGDGRVLPADRCGHIPMPAAQRALP
jgi:hypothetical protein